MIKKIEDDSWISHPHDHAGKVEAEVEVLKRVEHATFKDN